LAASDVVQQLTGSEVGTVSLIQRDLPTLVDSRVAEMETIYGGCGVPNHTLAISPKDLIRVLNAQVFEFTEFKT
jgi:prolyl-tRNA editing enzyme YbaK/EbsC (Cys-tRNA(Pro) deacylase)